MTNTKLTIYAIETNNGVYVSKYPGQPSYYHDSGLETYLFDGAKPTKTFHAIWSKIDNPPKRVSHIQSRPNINHRFVLIDDSLASEKIPMELTREQAGEQINCQTFQWKPEYEIYKSLYLEVSDLQEPIEVDDEFEYIVLAVIDDIKEPKKISYPFKQSGVYGKSGEITNNEVSQSLLDQIVYPTLILHERPCKLSSKQSYDIIREHVKLNINPQIATVSSDYDFCFEVQKIIPIAKPYTYEYKDNFRNHRRRIQTQYVKDRKVKCFEMTNASDNYKGYTAIPGFEGKNEDDLKEKIDLYLKELIDMINEPLKECPHCEGTGVTNGI